MGSPPRTIEWIGGLDGHVALIDQTLLPNQLKILEISDVKDIWHAIKVLQVRGAPAIGIAAAMGLVLALRNSTTVTREAFQKEMRTAAQYIEGARPTAVNLPWALRRMQAHLDASESQSVSELKLILLEEAKTIREEDAAMCRQIGAHGARLIQEGAGVLTHCNAGGLATAEYGTALAPIYTAHQQGRAFRVFADETRPLLQGARLTAWELQQGGVDVTLLCDNMAGALMAEGKVNLVITGADRIAANGDVANKIGTYGVAILAEAHGIPMYVAAPSSTFDFDLPDGSKIPIETRDPAEVREGFGKPTAPADVDCYCPAFDVTPARLIAGLITERGLIQPVSSEEISRVLRPA